MSSGDKNIGNDVVLREDARINFKRQKKMTVRIAENPDGRFISSNNSLLAFFNWLFKSYTVSFTPKERRISLPFAGKILIKLNIAIEKVLCKRIRLYKRMEH